MMSLDQIRAASDSMSRRAAKAGTVPLVLNIGAGDGPEALRFIPALGMRVPKGWRFIDKVFVDASGFGQPGEPAMTASEFVAYVGARPGFGWGIIEAGQFQVYVGQYQKKEAKGRGLDAAARERVYGRGSVGRLTQGSTVAKNVAWAKTAKVGDSIEVSPGLTIQKV